MTRREALSRLTAITDGIDREEADGGWWETSFGAERGTDVLAQLTALITELTA